MPLGRFSTLASLLLLGFISFASPVLAQDPAEKPPAAAPVAPAAAPAPASPAGVTPAASAAPAAAAAPTERVAPATQVAETAEVAPDPVAPPVATPAEAAAPAPPVEPPKPPATPQLKLELDNGTSIRFGLLLQTQYEARGNPANRALSHNLFIRRFAILLGGTVLKDFEYFFDTDFVDLMKAPTGAEGLKGGPTIQTKDAFATYKAVGDNLKIDGGLLLPPGSHNSLQGGPTIYALDFFSNTFRHSTVFASTNNPYGRDLGLQLRGIVGPLEYRAGVFQGRRNPPTATRPGSRNPFRYAARVQLNFLDPETAFFYGGTYLGAKKIFSLGGSADYQQDDGGSYKTFTGDVFVDLPVADDGVTVQVNVLHRDGGDRVALPKQTAIAAEAGYRFGAAKLAPILRFEHRYADPPLGDQTDLGAGLSWFAFGHTSNVKAFYTRVIPETPARAYDQYNLQWQLAFY